MQKILFLDLSTTRCPHVRQLADQVLAGSQYATVRPITDGAATLSKQAGQRTEIRELVDDAHVVVVGASPDLASHTQVTQVLTTDVLPHSFPRKKLILIVDTDAAMERVISLWCHAAVHLDMDFEAVVRDEESASRTAYYLHTGRANPPQMNIVFRLRHGTHR
ncbi:MAG: hypothetical protein ABF743_06065 [Schleiferilactobacillus perolens]|uniref:hypothetical protein n=1 Tax=Schleiferilactobacillus perolens TaxID=100468 RepID=UPI0039EAB32A